MELRQSKVIRVEIEVSEIVMGLGVTGVELERGRESIESFNAIALLGFDDAQVAMGIGGAVLLLDGPGVKFSRTLVPPFVEHQRLLERTQARGKLEDLRRG